MSKFSDIKNKFDAMPWQKQVVFGVLTVGTTVTTAYFAGKGVMLLYNKLFNKKTPEKELQVAIDQLKEVVKNNPDIAVSDTQDATNTDTNQISST